MLGCMLSYGHFREAARRGPQKEVDAGQNIWLGLAL